MPQQWLTVIGLGIDFVGFCLVLREWWLAVFNEARQIELEEQLERARALRTFARSSASGHPPHNPYETLDRMQDEMAIQKARTLHRQAIRARRGIFVLAAALIVIGYGLQIVGAWPGCCELIGILPQP